MEDSQLATARARLADYRSHHLTRLVAHEVRNALAGIGGALEVVRKRLAPEQGVERKACEAMQERLRGVDVLMEDLVAIAGSRDERRSRVRLADLARTAAAVVAGEHGRDGAWLQTRGQEEVTVDGDADLLRLLLHSFVSAAVVAVGTERGPFEVTVVRRGTDAVVEVAAPTAGPLPDPWDRARIPLALARRLLGGHGAGELKAVGPTRLRLQLPLA